MLYCIRLFCLLVISLICCACNHAQETLIPGVDGKQYQLSDFVGKDKWTVVNIWATRCPYCRHELFDLNNFHEEHYLNKNAPKDAIVIGLTIQFPEYTMPDRTYIAQFKEDYLIEYPLLLVDKALATTVVGEAVDMVPLTFIYNPKGKLVYQIKGMVTQAMLEHAISRDSDDYQVVWAKAIPAEYRPNALADDIKK